MDGILSSKKGGNGIDVIFFQSIGNRMLAITAQEALLIIGAFLVQFLRNFLNIFRQLLQVFLAEGLSR